MSEYYYDPEYWLHEIEDEETAVEPDESEDN